jgi:hypothetical protein
MKSRKREEREGRKGGERKERVYASTVKAMKNARRGNRV